MASPHRKDFPPLSSCDPEILPILVGNSYMFEDFGTQGGARYRWDMLEIGGNLFQYNDKTKRRKVGPNAPMKKLDHEQINNGRAKKRWDAAERKSRYP